MSGDDNLNKQDDVEQLLKIVGANTEDDEQTPDDGKTGAAEQTIDQSEIDYLLSQAQEAVNSITAGVPKPNLHGTTQFELEKFSTAPASTETATFDMIRDVDLDLKIELGRTNMYLEDVLKLRKGAVVPLDKLVDDPVDIYVNGQMIARGEVLVLNGNFCIRVTELIDETAAE